MVKRAHDEKIGRFILGNMTLVPLIPFVALLVVGGILFTGAMERSIVGRISQTARDHALMVDTFLKERRADLQLVAASSAFETLSTAQGLKEAFSYLRESSGAFADLGVFDASGMHVAYTGPFRLEGMHYGKEAWFQRTMDEGTWISDIFLGFRKTPHMVVAVRVDKDQAPWVLRATIDTDLFESLAGSVRIGETGEAFLVNSHGLYQSQRASRGRLMGRDPDSENYSGDAAGARVIRCVDGIKRVVAAAGLSEKPWQLVVVQDKREALGGLANIYLVITAVMLAGGAALLAVGYGVTSRIISRMRRTDDQAEHLEEQLFRAARLAELGEMAAGFAHEINNPLQVMQSELAYMKEVMGDVKGESEACLELEESMAQLKLQITRCSEITRSVLSFGRKESGRERSVKVTEFLDAVVRMVGPRAEVGGVRFEVKTPGENVSVQGDASRLQQVVLNLINNALDAVAARHGSRGGEVQVSAFKEGGALHLGVKDNGEGMDEERRAKIFSPFFTSKPPGAGTGLGLSVCHGIVESMGGHIDVESICGEGSCFTVVLPLDEPQNHKPHS
ncbi:MAG: sensor histidine kinase [Desulfobacterales bacterium]|nr:sensor histidine kinase [Desulfobacterales bacterium]